MAAVRSELKMFSNDVFVRTAAQHRDHFTTKRTDRRKKKTIHLTITNSGFTNSQLRTVTPRAPLHDSAPCNAPPTPMPSPPAPALPELDTPPIDLHQRQPVCLFQRVQLQKMPSQPFVPSDVEEAFGGLPDSVAANILLCLVNAGTTNRSVTLVHMATLLGYRDVVEFKKDMFHDQQILSEQSDVVRLAVGANQFVWRMNEQAVFLATMSSPGLGTSRSAVLANNMRRFALAFSNAWRMLPTPVLVACYADIDFVASREWKPMLCKQCAPVWDGHSTCECITGFI